MPPRRSRGRHRRRNSDENYGGEGDEDNDEEGPLLKRIDRNLPPIVPHDLGEWNSRLDDLQDDDTRAADTFATTGTYSRRGQRYRASIDFNRHKIDRDSGVIFVTSCDVDSVIATIFGDLPISPRANFGYFMLADPSFTLTENLHIPLIDIVLRPAREGGIPRTEAVPVHHIPNARFGKMERFLILIFFPELYDPEDRNKRESPNVVNDERMALFYNLAVRVATNTVIPAELRNQWPASYDDELFRVGPLRNRNDQAERLRRVARLVRLHTERIVHGHLFNRWLREIKRLCGEVPELVFARGFFLLVDGKGLKDHNLSDHEAPLHAVVDEEGDLIDPENPRTVAIEAVLSDFFVPANFVYGEWYIDIATKVRGHLGDEHGPPVSLFINSDLHPEIINHFSEVPLNECSRSVRRRINGYARDEVAHLAKLAGLRKTFDPPAGNGIVNFQAYSSDKSLTYRPDVKTKAIRSSPYLCLKNWPEQDTGHFRKLADAYWRAPETHSVTVRFESRIPYESYPYVHLRLRASTLRSWLLWFRNTAFWGFKWRRLNAYWNVLEAICAAEEARSNFSLSQLSEVGSLLILLVYMANALVNRPDDGGNFDQVHDTGCVHEVIDYQLVPVIQLGYYVIHSLHYPPIERITSRLPRISSLRTLPRKTIIYLLATEKSERTELHVLRLFCNNRKRQADEPGDGDAWGVARQMRRIVNPHTSNKQQVTLSLPQPVPNVFANRLPDQDLREVYSSEEDDDEARERAPSLGGQISTLVYTYPLQIIAKIPNRKLGLGSWSRLTADERANANFELFCDASAPQRVFESWTNFGRDGTRWDATLATLFPTIQEYERMGKTQNLSQMSVWKDWYTALLQLSKQGQENTVRETRKYVSENWKWLPFATKKKLWVTGESSAITINRQEGPEKGGPWIVFNPRFLN